MKVSFRHFAPGEKIPVEGFLKERKLAKYFSRETAAAVVCVGELLAGARPAPDTPAYYGMGVVEHESFGLDCIAAASAGQDGRFSQARFVEEGFMSVPPLNQFKVLYNMPLCFVSIVFGLKGDNAAMYSSASGLLAQAILAPSFPVLIGAGKSHQDGSVSAAFSLADKADLEALVPEAAGKEAIELFVRRENA